MYIIDVNRANQSALVLGPTWFHGLVARKGAREAGRSGWSDLAASVLALRAFDRPPSQEGPADKSVDAREQKLMARRHARAGHT